MLMIALAVVHRYRPIPKPLEQPSTFPGITQVATIDSLLAGVYDGETRLDVLSSYGNFGIGTFQGLDGEMVLLDGVFYQVKADGNVYRPGLLMTTPFASVMFFPKYGVGNNLNPAADYESLCRQLDQSVPNPNVPVAIRIDGHFSTVRTRSVPAQQKPYKPLAEVTKNQPEFDFENVDGTVIGFRLPEYVRGINVPGYHLHFITADRKRGGHLLRIAVESGRFTVVSGHRFQVLLPENVADFSDVDFSKDRSKELEKVEK